MRKPGADSTVSTSGSSKSPRNWNTSTNLKNENRLAGQLTAWLFRFLGLSGCLSEREAGMKIRVLTAMAGAAITVQAGHVECADEKTVPVQVSALTVLVYDYAGLAEWATNRDLPDLVAARGHNHGRAVGSEQRSENG